MNMPAGAIISAPKGLVTHVGLHLGNGWVFHNNPANGEHISPIDSFSKGKPVSVADVLSGPELIAAWERVSQALGAPKCYDPLANNCEHSLCRALGKPKSSPQLQCAAFMSLILLGIACLFTRK